MVLSKLPIGDVATQYFADRYYLYGSRECYEQKLDFIGQGLNRIHFKEAVAMMFTHDGLLKN